MTVSNIQMISFYIVLLCILGQNIVQSITAVNSSDLKPIVKTLSDTHQLVVNQGIQIQKLQDQLSNCDNKEKDIEKIKNSLTELKIVLSDYLLRIYRDTETRPRK